MEELCELVKYTPNVKNVFLAWNVGPLEDVSGLLKMLSLLSPESLYLGYQRHSGLDRRKSDELAALLEDCIAHKWLSLVSFLPTQPL